MRKLLLCFGLILLFSCQEDTKAPSPLLDFVPPKTSAILKTKNLNTFAEKTAKNSLLNSNKKFPFFKYFEEASATLKHLNLNEKSLLCFNKVGRDEVALTLITQGTPELVNTDSITNKKVESFEYDRQTVKKYTIENRVSFAVKLNQTNVISTSKLVLENIIRNYNTELPQDAALEKIFATAAYNDASLFLNNEEMKEVYTNLLPNRSTAYLNNFTDWIELDLNIKDNNIKFNGVTTAHSDKRRILNIFKDVESQPTETAKVTPLNATGFYAFTYDRFENLKNNLFDYRKKDLTAIDNEALFDSAKEIGVIYAKDRPAIVLNSIDKNMTEHALLGNQEVTEEFRGIKIYKYAHSDSFYDAFFPLIKIKGLAYYTMSDHFFIFSKELQTLENIIANIQNQTVLAAQPYYRQASEQLSDESSILLVGINTNVKKYLAEGVADKFQASLKDFKLEDYEMSALQLVYNKNYAHVNGIIQKSNAEDLPQGSVQVGSIKLEEPLATDPQFVKNWRSKNNDIAVQGESNTLYVYDYKGNLRWKKQLDGRILGKIELIDIYNNGRLQLAFVTQNKFYIVDKDGKIVKPFPLSFKSEITQPLAVFDYDHISKYRFIVTQGNTVTMYDKQGKVVSGFKFKKTKSTITQAPKHIRIGKKDYIVVPEENGQLHILDRVGNTRVSVKKKLDLRQTPWYLYNGKFTSTNTKGQLVQIDEKGNVSKKDAGLSDKNDLIATPHTLVTFSRNKLTIKGKEIELDFGLYSAPELFYFNDKIYVATTDTQASKTYVFDSNAKLLPGFPVYGNSGISLGNMDNVGHLEFVVKGEKNSILIYQLD